MKTSASSRFSQANGGRKSATRVAAQTLCAVLSLFCATSDCGRCSAAESQPPTAGSGQNQASGIKALRLVQSHEFFGDLQLTVAQGNVRMDSTGRMNFTMIASAPKWDVAVFRNDDKVIKVQPLSRFENNGLVTEMLLSNRPNTIKSSAPPYKFKYYGLDARRIGNKDDVLEYLPAGGVITPEVVKVVHGALRYSDGNGLAVKYMEVFGETDFITGMDMKGRREVCLTTSSAKWITVPKDFFAVPKNYRVVGDIQAVTTSTKLRNQSEDFSSLLDGDEKSAERARDRAKIRAADGQRH